MGIDDYPCFISYTNTSSEWILDLQIEAQTIKLLKENTGGKNSGACKNFLIRIQKA